MTKRSVSDVSEAQRGDYAAGQSGLLERNSELAQLRDVVAKTADGRGSVVVIEGPAGIGKTRLLEALSGLAGDACVRVAWARASELERDYGFGVLRQLLEPAVTSPEGCLRESLFTGAAALAAPLFKSGPSPAAAVVEPDYATLHGLYWLLAELAEEQPIAVCVDDVQWADPPSLRFLSFVARRLANLGATIFTTLRSGEVGTDPELVAQLTAESGVLVLRPGPLTEEGVSDLARQELAVEPSRDLVEACLESTGGNPFYLRALLGELAHGIGDVGAGSVRRITRMGSDQIGGVLLRRLDALPAGAKELAQAVAVLGDGTNLGLGARLVELEPPAAEHVRHSLVQAGFLVGRDVLAFTHPIVRSSVYGTLSPCARSQLHKDAAELLEREGARVEAVASHLTHVLPEGDSRTVATLRAAARSTQAVGAPESSVGFLKRALLEPPPAGGEIQVLLELGRVEMRAGSGEAVGHLEEVIRRPGSSPAQRGLAALDLGEFFMHALRGEEGIPILEAGLAAAVHVEPSLAKRLEATLIFNAYGRLDIRRQLLDRVRALKPPMGTPEEDPARLLFATLAYDQVAGSGQASRAIVFAQECLDYRGPIQGSTEGTAMALALCGLLGADRPVEAEEHADRMIDIARTTGSITTFCQGSALRASIRNRRGNLAGAEADARAALAIRISSSEVVRPLLVAVIVDSLTCRGDFEGAEAEALSIRSDQAVNSPTWQWLRAATVDLRLARGEVREALEEAEHFAAYEAGWGAGPGVGLYEWRWHAAAAHVAAGEVDAARDVAEEQLELARSFGSPRALGIALRTCAALDTGRDGVEMLREALPHLPQERSALERVRTLVELGAALRRSGHRTEAREPLQEAMDIGRTCGALMLARRAHTELRAAGGHPRSPLRTGLDGLTPSERRVAEMAAAGLTNKEVAQALFVTVKTIEMHLANVFRKLGVGSRSQLQDALLVPLQASPST